MRKYSLNCLLADFESWMVIWSRYTNTRYRPLTTYPSFRLGYKIGPTWYPGNSIFGLSIALSGRQSHITNAGLKSSHLSWAMDYPESNNESQITSLHMIVIMNVGLSTVRQTPYLCYLCEGQVNSKCHIKSKMQAWRKTKHVMPIRLTDFLRPR